MVKYSVLQRKNWIKTLDSRVSSSTVLIEDTSGRLLVVKANYKRYWSTPGGVIDKGESPLVGAVRETLEEVGIKLTRHQLDFGWVVYRTSSDMETYQFVFKANIPIDADATKINLQASEIEDYAWVTKDQVLSGDRHYAKVVERWANNSQSDDSYVEQTYAPTRERLTRRNRVVQPL